jgi:hypothetical protein
VLPQSPQLFRSTFTFVHFPVLPESSAPHSLKDAGHSHDEELQIWPVPH